MIMGETNSGKSCFLVHVGGEALREGKRVFHISLEMGLPAMKERYLSNLNKPPKWRIKRDCLHILCAKPHSIGVNEILGRAEAFEHKPDVIVIDSGELLRCKREFSQVWDEETYVWEDMKALAEEMNCVVWTCCQSNREGYSKKILHNQNTAGSMGKPRTCDFVVTINPEELGEDYSEEDLPRARFFLAKNRYGPKHMLANIVCDFENSHFEEELI